MLNISTRDIFLVQYLVYLHWVSMVCTMRSLPHKVAMTSKIEYCTKGHKKKVFNKNDKYEKFIKRKGTIGIWKKLYIKHIHEHALSLLTER